MSNDDVSAMGNILYVRLDRQLQYAPMAEAFHRRGDHVTTMTDRAESAPLLSRDRIIAAPGFNRWLVPPAALAIHLSIGMAYGLSVFWLPLSRAIGITKSAPDDWKISTLTWTFTLAIVFLGS